MGLISHHRCLGLQSYVKVALRLVTTRPNSLEFLLCGGKHLTTLASYLRLDSQAYDKCMRVTFSNKTEPPHPSSSFHSFSPSDLQVAWFRLRQVLQLLLVHRVAHGPLIWRLGEHQSSFSCIPIHPLDEVRQRGSW